MSPSRKSPLAAGAATLLIAATAFAGSAAAETWRMATKVPADSPEGRIYQRFAEKVEEFSNGEMEIRIFPSEQLGASDAVLEQLKQGTVHIYAEGTTLLIKFVPDIAWESAPFLFDDRAHWERFNKTDLAQGWYRQAAEESGVMVLGDPTAILRGPYRVMVSKVDVQSFEDLQGLKLRLSPNKLALAMWTHMGADIRTLAFTEVYQAIDTGIVEAVNSPISLVESMRFYEVAPHIAKHSEYEQAIGLMTNRQAFEGLEPDLQQALLRAQAEAGAYSYELLNQITDESIARMKAAGATFTVLDRQPFIDSMAEFYAEMAERGELPEGFLRAVEATREP
ncbi:MULTISPECIES: TRAP transporter substrate-binding protein [unclassified Roseitalea]|uniref:TRAP transporter substrate-binding protein n=1 Tax=unclassified Roseitalea TaxID=2639107 RepID=UPI00273E68CA|nr:MULTISPECIES: TRAP transporter substrate-binding protein [unclassified Roseitalea]